MYISRVNKYFSFCISEDKHIAAERRSELNPGNERIQGTVPSGDNLAEIHKHADSVKSKLRKQICILIGPKCVVSEFQTIL